MVDLIIKGEFVITQANPLELVKNGAVAVSGSRITAVGPAREIEAMYGKQAKVLTSKKALVMPGLINAHTHAAMTCFRGLADDLPLMTWLHENIFPAEQKLNPDIVYWSSLLGCAEMIRSGTTFFCDMYLFEKEVAKAADEAGLRAVLGEVLYDFPSPNYGPPEKGLQYSEELINDLSGHERLTGAVEPHAPYTCSPELLISCRDLAERKGVSLITHLSETADEVHDIRKQYGYTPVRHLDNIGLLSDNLLATHCVVLDAQEIDLLATRGVRVGHNPRSNMKLASGRAPVPELLKAGVTVGLGTDGAASNNNLDMFREMDVAAKLQKSGLSDPEVMDAAVTLELATEGAAAALGMAGETGKLAPGFLADIIVLDLDQPHLTPLYNPASHLVYAARGADVIHNVTHGQILMENRKLTTIDLDELRLRMENISRIMSNDY